MFRYAILGASALTLLAAPALAEKDQSDKAMKKAGDENAKAALVQPVKIVNASQVVTRDDAKRLAETEFAAADLDESGKISKAEFLAYAVAKTTPAMNSTAKAGAAGVTPTTTASASEGVTGEGDIDTPAITTPQAQFALIANSDDAISKEELIASRVADFDIADANDDALLSDDEQIQFAALVAIAAPAATY